MDQESRDQTEHAAIAFWGLRPRPKALKAIYTQSIAWLGRHGCQPDLMGTDLDGGNMVRHSRSEAKLIARRFTGTSLLGLATLMDGVRDHLSGTKAEIAYDASDNGYLVIAFQTLIVDLPSDELLEIAREACALTYPAYGIGYRRRFLFGPVCYGMPLAEGPCSEQEATQITQWMSGVEEQVFLRGQLRDVYPWNFLTAPALQRSIDGIALADWIGKRPNRGRLSRLTDSVALWEVGDLDIPPLRQSLSDAGIIYHHERDTLPPRPLSPPMTPEDSLQGTLEAFGMSAEEVDILKVEQFGKTRKLSDAEVKKITGQRKRGNR
jgi:hypothetical protein